MSRVLGEQPVTDHQPCDPPLHPLLEPSTSDSDRGRLVGRDPRGLTPGDFEAAGVKLIPATKAIRAKCIDCAGGSLAEARKCISTSCPLWPIRLGFYPALLRAAANAHGKIAEEEIGL